jgi:hypothetical protein
LTAWLGDCANADRLKRSVETGSASPNSLVAGNLAGNLAIFPPFRRFQHQFTTQFQYVAADSLLERSRESVSPEQGMRPSEQGNSYADRQSSISLDALVSLIQN